MTFPVRVGLSWIAGSALLLTAGAVPAAAAPVKLTIKAVENPGVTFTSQLNPASLLVEKAVPWKTLPGGHEPPTQQFDSPESSLLTATLNFDTFAQNTDVADLVAPLEQFAMIDPVLGRPPIVRLQYGSLAFTGVIESLSVKYSLFAPDGTKGRAVVKFGIRAASGAEVLPH